jgi:hypothetical protein
MREKVKELFSSHVFLSISAGVIAAIVVVSMTGSPSLIPIMASGLVSTVIVLVFKINSLERRLTLLAEMTTEGINGVSEGIAEVIDDIQQEHNNDIQEVFQIIAKKFDGDED